MDARWDIVRESFREAKLLLARWSEALDAPRTTVVEVADGVEDRLVGACQGVRIGGARAIDELLLPALVSDAAPAVTIAALLVAQLRPDAMHDALPRVRRLDACARGLALAPDPYACTKVARRLDAHAPEVQAAFVDAYALGSEPPPVALAPRLDVTSPAVCRALLRFAARWRPTWALTWAQWGQRRSDPDVREAATKLALLLGVRGTSAHAVELVEQGRGADLLPLLAMRHGERVLPIVVAALRRGMVERGVFEALVCIGTRAALDLCVASLGDRDRARAAAWAIETIAGVRVPAARRDPHLARLRGSEALLPWPDAAAFASRWSELRAELPTGVRLLAGRRFDDAARLEALAHGPTRARRVLGLELDFHTHGRVHVDTHTWTVIQRAQLEAPRRAKAA